MMPGMTSRAGTGTWATADGAALQAIRRPDGAWSIQLPHDQPSAWPALVEAATRDGCGTLVLTRPAGEDDEHLLALQRAGFQRARTETIWRLPVAAIPTTAVRTEHRLVPVTDLDPEAVVALDNAIRADIPGCEGWVATGAQLAATFDDADFDPALYLVAQHLRTGGLEGLVRVWDGRPDPRLGCIGVAASCRRTSLTLVLLQAVARTLEVRGVRYLTAETDHTNRASQLMATSCGGTAVETSVEWRRPTPAGATATPPTRAAT